MVDFKKILQDFPCDDCSLIYSDYKDFLNHRKCHTCSFRRTITEETLLEESCPLCLVKYPEKYKNKCLEGLLGTGRTVKMSERGTKAKQVLRCKYYPKCSAEFYHFTEYTNHAKGVHSDNKPYACQQCNYTTGQYGHLKRHLRSRACCKRYKCNLCPEAYAAKSNLHNHLKSVHDEYKVFQCELCLKKFVGYNRFKDHSLIHEDCNCIYCGEKYTELEDLKMHLRIHFPTPNTKKCHLCSKELPTKQRLRAHIQAHYKVFACHLCPKDFVRELYLKRHLLSHKEVTVRSHDCTYCGEKYTELDDLKSHVRIHFPTPNTTKCHLCGKEHPTTAGLKSHLKTHYKLFKCHLCPKRCALKINLKTHFLSCHKEVNMTSYDCSHCGKRFATPSILKKHLKLHSSTVAKYQCLLCPKEYATGPSLKRHLLSHAEVNVNT